MRSSEFVRNTLTRAAELLRLAKRPRTAKQLARIVRIPPASIYRLLHALEDLGWLRNAGKSENGSVYVTTSPEYRFPGYPRSCPRCHRILWSPEHRRKHDARSDGGSCPEM